MELESGLSVFRVSNGLDSEIFFAVFERDALAGILWVPCVDPGTCPRIESRRIATFPVQSIRFYRPDADDAVFYWWRLVPAEEGGFRPDEVRSIVFEL